MNINRYAPLENGPLYDKMSVFPNFRRSAGHAEEGESDDTQQRHKEDFRKFDRFSDSGRIRKVRTTEKRPTLWRFRIEIAVHQTGTWIS